MPPIDVITAAFVGALQAGLVILQTYSIPLLAAFALIAFYIELGPLLAAGGAGMGDALGGVLLAAMKAGVFYWLLVNLIPMSNAAFLTFFQWGLAPAGGGFDASQFVRPSFVMEVGFKAAVPLRDFMDRHDGWSAVWNWHTLLVYAIAYVGITLSFAFVALHLMVTIIEFHMAVLVGAVLIPVGVLRPTAFFTEFALGWVTGGLVRVLVTAAIIGIAVPLFELVILETTPGGDPTFYSAVLTVVTAGIFGILSWVIPGRAAAIAGRGLSLAITGSTLLAPAVGGIRNFRDTIRGASELIAARRRAP